ncbi:MAG: DUF4270 family protein [Bacteroidales bacterium]
MRLNDLSLCKRSFYLKANIHNLILLLFSIFIFTSCEEASFIGLEIQPDSDRFYVNDIVHRDIGSSVWERDSIIGTDLSRSLLGELSDPLFGVSDASFITQVGISSVNHNFGPDAQPHSLVLYLRISGSYGDATAPQIIKVYELNEIPKFDSTYYSNLDVSQKIFPEILADYTYSPATGDSIIAIPITSAEFQQKLINAPDSAKQSIGQFITYIKGIYVTAAMTGETGSMNSINLNHNDSRLSLFYTNSEIPDSVRRYNYVITADANKVSLFSKDYSSAVFSDILGQTNTGEPLFYAQGAGGVTTRLDFESLHTWQDSMPVSINSARLILPVETNSISATFPAPARLTLLEENEEGDLFTISDITIGDDYFGGVYNEELGQYSFNITNFIQSYIKGRRDNSSLIVSVRDAGIVPHRIVLRGKDHQSGGPRLEITYTNH